MGLGVLAAIAGAVLLVFRSPAAPPVKPELAAASAPVVPAPPAPLQPSFDIVRIGPTGNAVIAGRSAPDVDVTVLNEGKPIGVAHADESGSWMLIPAAPLPEGAAELTLSSQSRSGPPVAGRAPVLLVIPGASAAPALAVLTPPSGPSRLLQGPEGSHPGRLGLDTVDYDDQGAIRFSGTSRRRGLRSASMSTAPRSATRRGMRPATGRCRRNSKSRPGCTSSGSISWAKTARS